jgi:hypothetical protein
MDLLYHCFPRRAAPVERNLRRISDSRVNEIGLEVLQSIFEDGLLLTPEHMRFPVDRGGEKKGGRSGFTLTQSRACFTLLSRSELMNRRSASLNSSKSKNPEVASHLERFGEFAIGLNPFRARVLGVMPVFYYYRSLGVDWEEDSVIHHDRKISLRDFGPSFEMVERLIEIRELMEVLSCVEAFGAPDGRPVPRPANLHEYGIGSCLEPNVSAALGRLNKKESRKFFDCLDTHRMPAWNMVEWIDIILNLFQIADEKNEELSLRYFQQREWRLVHMYSPQVECWPISLADETDERYLPPNWSLIASRIRAMLARHSEALAFPVDVGGTNLIVGSRSCRFRDFIDEVIVPLSCRGFVADYLVKFGGEWKEEIFEGEGKYSAFMRG